MSTEHEPLPDIPPITAIRVAELEAAGFSFAGNFDDQSGSVRYPFGNRQEVVFMTETLEERLAFDKAYFGDGNVAAVHNVEGIPVTVASDDSEPFTHRYAVRMDLRVSRTGGVAIFIRGDQDAVDAAQASFTTMARAYIWADRAELRKTPKSPFHPGLKAQLADFRRRRSKND